MGELSRLVPALTFLLQKLPQALCSRFTPNRYHLNTHFSFPLVLWAHSSSHWYRHPPTGSFHLPLSISHSFFISFGSLSNLLSSNHKLPRLWSNLQNLSLSLGFAIHFSWEKLHNFLGTQSSHLDSGLINLAQRIAGRIRERVNIKV